MYIIYYIYYIILPNTLVFITYILHYYKYIKLSSGISLFCCYNFFAYYFLTALSWTVLFDYSIFLIYVCVSLACLRVLTIPNETSCGSLPNYFDLIVSSTPHFN